MNDTYVTVVGNVVTTPERRRVEQIGATVVSFRLGSTARRFDKARGGWVDGQSVFLKVNCWRGLADNVYQCVFKGDPVVVHGRLYTREYEAEDGTRRVSYELEATAVGHNLARGTANFRRTRAVHAATDADTGAEPEASTDADDSDDISASPDSDVASTNPDSDVSSTGSGSGDLATCMDDAPGREAPGDDAQDVERDPEPDLSVTAAAREAVVRVP